MLLSDLITDISEVIPFEYDQIKTAKFEKIINSFLQKASPQQQPLIIHMAGIPGAGKTTFYHSRPWPEHVFVAFDDIMESMDEYQHDLKNLGTVEAFAKWELPARIIGYELLRRAAESRRNIFVDNGGSSNAHLCLMKNIKNWGYRSEMYYISCPLETAIARTAKREKETSRHTPVEMIKDRYVKTLKNIKEYQKIVDKFYHFDSSEKSFLQQTA